MDDDSRFRYPGPKPSSKEAVILMLADSIEAASKSLKEPSAENLNQLIDAIVAGKIQQGQLEESDLTFKELRMVMDQFNMVLRSAYHSRVKYPDQKVEN